MPPKRANANANDNGDAPKNTKERKRRLILMDFLQPKVWQLVIFDPTTVYCTSKRASRMGLADGNTFEVT